jgi:hypothetical protein
MTHGENTATHSRTTYWDNNIYDKGTTNFKTWQGFLAGEIFNGSEAAGPMITAKGRAAASSNALKTGPMNLPHQLKVR